MLADALPFPLQRPEGIVERDQTPFDPARHLALTFPERVWTLKEWGYDEATCASTPSPLVMTSPFRILSAEGVAAFRRAIEAISPDKTVASGRRLSTLIRGGVYRSRFIRELCLSPEIAQHLSKIAGAPLVPHTIPQVLAYINLAPLDPSRGIDSWHVDSIGFDTVMLGSDPQQIKGGRFEYFEGTRDEVCDLLRIRKDQLTYGWDDPLPANRVKSPVFPDAGWALFMQGNLVFHCATKLEVPCERTTLVAGYVPRDVTYPDPTQTQGMQSWQSLDLLTEVTRHAAWLGRGKLDRLIAEMGFVNDRVILAAKLEEAIADVQRVIQEMRIGPVPADIERRKD